VSAQGDRFVAPLPQSHEKASSRVRFDLHCDCFRANCCPDLWQKATVQGDQGRVEAAEKALTRPFYFPAFDPLNSFSQYLFLPPDGAANVGRPFENPDCF
jgi:hypothetical protein